MHAYTTPMAISGMGTKGQVCLPLERVALWAETGTPVYTEAWLQDVIDRHPALLPLAEIEPAFAHVVSVGRELSVSSGFIDNLLVTPEGGIAVVETKLWRNPEARRTVVAQILEYASDLAALEYDAFQAMIGRARGKDGFSLFRHVCPNALPAAEGRFIDAVARNLRLGRLLLLIVGDGIQEGVERLSDYLQRHMGLHFTLGLVELSLWRNPRDGSVIVQPRVMAQTVQIERAVIRVQGTTAAATVAIAPAKEAASRPASLSLETFLDELAVDDPDLPGAIRAFIEQAAAIGISADMRNSKLGLNWTSPGGRVFSLGIIQGFHGFDTSAVGRSAHAIGRLDLAMKYQRDLMRRLPGTHLHETPQPQNSWIADEKEWCPWAADVLDPETGALAVMTKYIRALKRAIEAAPALAAE